MTLAHKILWDLFPYLLWDLCPRWYHMGLLSIHMHTKDIMGIMSIRSYRACFNVSYGTLVQDGIIWDYCPSTSILRTYGTIVHRILWDLCQCLLWDFCPRRYHMGLLSIHIYAEDIMGPLSIESYGTRCNISYGTSVQDGIIWDYCPPTCILRTLWD